MENLAEAFQRELNRNLECLEEYIKLGSVGAFGAAAIKDKINQANAVLASGDVIEMMMVYKGLKNTE